MTDENAKAARLLRRALDVLGPNGEQWTTLKYETAFGQHCLVGAIRKVLGKSNDIYADLPNGPLWTPSPAERALTEFNDYHSFPEVRAIVERAIARLEGA